MSVRSITVQQLNFEQTKALGSVLIVPGRPEENITVLNDPRFGDTNKRTCVTCPRGFPCPGHPGYVELKHVIFHPLHITRLCRLCHSMCPKCHRFAVEPSNEEMDEDSDDGEASVCTISRSRTMSCSCGQKMAMRVKFVGEQSHHLQMSDGPNVKPIDLLRYMRDDIQQVRAIMHSSVFDPEVLFVRYIIVVPPCIRPSGYENGQNVIDAITIQYQYLLDSLYKLDGTKTDADAYRAGAYNRFAKLLGLTTTNDSAQKFLKQRITGKDGFFRRFCIAKRMNYCGRSVISPDHTIDLNEIGLPRSFASDMLTKDANGELRPLRNGDFVIANRQPSLQRTSMLALKVRLMDEGHTIRLNPAVITPFNADFDGDEMTVHSVVNAGAKMEAKRLCSVTTNMIGFKDSKLNFGVSQDTMTGLHILSHDDVDVDSRFLNADVIRRARRAGIYRMSGRLLISSTFPSDFRYDDGNIKIDDGLYLQGILIKKSFWSGNECVLKTYLTRYGATQTVKYISDVQRVIGWWLLARGLSVTLNECRGEPPAELPDVDESNHIIVLGRFKMESEESSMQLALRKERESGQKRGLVRMIASGTKGDRNNLGQIMSCVGQQNVFGLRPSKPIPHFDDTDQNPAAKGFVTSSYFSGLKPHEMFYHAQMGREGIVRTGISTSDTGYGQRMIVKILEGIRVCEDKTVRDADDTIVQFGYGRDRCDTSKIYSRDDPLGLAHLQDAIDAKRI